MIRVYKETPVTLMPKKYFANKEALDGMAGVFIAWKNIKKMKAYYNKMGRPIPELELVFADAKGFEDDIKPDKKVRKVLPKRSKDSKLDS